MKKSGSFLLLLCVISFTSFSKVLSVKIGVNGLTCSQCSRNVEMQIRKLSFVKDVEMNLEHTEGVITFKENETVNFHKIAQAVVDAGFSVRYLSSEITIDDQNIQRSDTCYSIENAAFNFVDLKKISKGDKVNLLFLGKEYQEKKEYQKWKPKIKPGCLKPGSKQSYTVAMT